jgi:glycosyltransferase involved in cell wall biosynthesis
LPDAQLRVIGREPRPGLSGAIERYRASVVLEGYVEDLDSALSTATALVNPLRFGSGVKIKVIEALGRGVPIVSTPVGADGIAAGLGEGLLIGDSTEEFVRWMVQLVDPATNEEASRAAATHFARVYSRTAGFRAYDTAILTPELLGRSG